MTKRKDENKCVEDSMSHDEYMKHMDDKEADRQRRKYGKSNRDYESEMQSRRDAGFGSW